MSKQTEAKWVRRVAAWRGSGLSAPRFVAGRGFTASTLMFWASKLKRERPETAAISFVRVERSPGPTRPVTIMMEGATLDVLADTDEVALAKAVRALRGRP